MPRDAIGASLAMHGSWPQFGGQMIKRRKAAFAMAACGLMLSPIALNLPGANAAPARDTTATDTRGSNVVITVPTKDTTTPVTIGSIEFDAAGAETRYVTSAVSIYMSNSNPDPFLGVFLGLTCYGGGGQSVSSAQNVIAGSPVVTFNPRMILKIPSAGHYSCILKASGARPAPATAEGDTSSYYTVQAGSSLSASVPTDSWAEQFDVDPSDLSVVLRNAGQTVNPIGAETFTIGSGFSAFDLISDHKYTVCSSSKGSDDRDGRGDLCTGSDVVPFSTGYVRVDTKVRQYKDYNTWCDAGTTYSESIGVNRDRHHVMSYNKYRVSVDPGCSNRFSISSTTTLTSGTAVVVHYRSEHLMVTR